jgi:hypothetical protein
MYNENKWKMRAYLVHLLLCCLCCCSRTGISRHNKMVEMWVYLRNGMGNPQVFHNTIVFILYSRSSCSMAYYCIILIMHHFWASPSRGAVKIAYCIMHHIFGRFMHYEIQFYVGGKAFGRWHPIWVIIFSADMAMMVIFYTFHQLSVA